MKYTDWSIAVNKNKNITKFFMYKIFIETK